MVGIMQGLTPNLSTSIDAFTINSEPNGAKVFCGGKELGTTPITLEVAEYHSKMIRLSKNEYSKVFLLSRSQKTYNLKLEKQIPIYQISEPSELEFPKPHISNNTPPENSSDDPRAVLAVGVVAIVLFLICLLMLYLVG